MIPVITSQGSVPSHRSRRYPTRAPARIDSRNDPALDQEGSSAEWAGFAGVSCFTGWCL